MGDVTYIAHQAEQRVYKKVLERVRARINYWNSVAYDKRQAGIDDTDGCARAGALQILEQEIKRWKAE